MVRAAGATEVHMRISCPPTISPCFYGVDTPRKKELIAATHTLEEIRKYLGADTLAYLSLDGMMGAVQGGKSRYCASCYTGVYPVAFPRDEAAYLQLALKLNPASGLPMAEPQPLSLGSGRSAADFETDSVDEDEDQDGRPHALDPNDAEDVLRAKPRNDDNDGL
jgi:hypothetical protein